MGNWQIEESSFTGLDFLWAGKLSARGGRENSRFWWEAALHNEEKCGLVFDTDPGV